MGAAPRPPGRAGQGILLRAREPAPAPRPTALAQQLRSALTGLPGALPARSPSGGRISLPRAQTPAAPQTRRRHHGRGLPSPSHPAASRPPPRRSPLATARGCLVPPSTVLPSVVLPVTHTLLFSSLVHVGLTSELGSSGRRRRRGGRASLGRKKRRWDAKGPRGPGLVSAPRGFRAL